MPSVAKISTSSASRSRARAAIPSRLATDSRARTRAFLLRIRGARPADARATSLAAEYSARHGILRHAPTTAADQRGRVVTLPPWDYLFLLVQRAQLPGPVHPIWIASLVLLVVLVVLYNVRTRALHRHRPTSTCGSGCGGPG